MTVARGRRWGWIVAGALALLVAAGVVGLRVAASILTDRVIVEAVGDAGKGAVQQIFQGEPEH